MALREGPPAAPVGRAPELSDAATSACRAFKARVCVTQSHAHIFFVVLSTLVAALMLQVRKLGALIRSLRAATGSSAVEVCSGLLTAPQLRSSFQSKAKKSTKKTAKFTDPQDTACSTPRDVDEEEL